MLDEKLLRAIQAFDLDSYVRATFSKVIPASGSELRVDCFAPKGCAGSDDHAHLWINTSKKQWICYKCNYGSSSIQKGTAFLPRFIADAERIPIAVAISKLVKLNDITPDSEDFADIVERTFGEPEEEDSEPEMEPQLRVVTLPKEFYKLGSATGTTSKKFKSYAIDRGFSTELQNLYDIRYCISGTFANRIAFPIYDQSGVCRSVVARIVGNSKMKAKWINWAKTDLARFFWPLGRWVNGLFHPNSMGIGRVVLTEGIMDAHAVRELTSRIAFACFGKKLSDGQLNLLHQNRVKEVILAWDRDAREKMVGMAKKLSGHFDVKVFPYRHPAWSELNLDLGDTLNPDCPLYSPELIEAEIDSAISVDSPEFCRWAADDA